MRARTPIFVPYPRFRSSATTAKAVFPFPAGRLVIDAWPTRTTIDPRLSSPASLSEAVLSGRERVQCGVVVV